MLIEKLDPTERQEWNTQLAIVKQGKEYVWATIEALSVIRKQRLFREEFKTFDDFVRSRLDMSARYASMLISASQDRSTLGTKVPENLSEKINNPWKLRNLKGLTPQSMKAVVERAESVADGKEITAKIIASSRKLIMGTTDDELVQEPTEQSDAMERFKSALSEIDSVDALQEVLSSFGGIDEQALIIVETQSELCEAIRAL